MITEFDTSCKPPLDIVGRSFGALTAIAWQGRVTRGRASRGDRKEHSWLFVCDCGRYVSAVGRRVASGHKRSCGCLASSVDYSAATSKRGAEKSEHRTWNSVKARCTNPNDKNFHRYGGRGIRMCQRWRDSSADFLMDVGGKPTHLHSIDRIDNGGHYSCGRCDECRANGWAANWRWATRDEQSRNRRTNVMIEWNGKRQCVEDWAAELGMKSSTIQERIRRGWRAEQALMAPLGSRKQKEADRGL